MLQQLKDWASGVVWKCGWDLRRASKTPFGVRWYNDIQYFPKGADLDVVFDVGANTGQTATRVVRSFPKSRVYSFEPVPTTFQELVRNTTKYANVQPVRCAMGSAIGRASMTAEPSSGRNTFVINSNAILSLKQTAQVEVDTIDRFCARNVILRINLLKVDTEGYEMQILRGAEGLMTANRIDFVLIECDFFRRTEEPHGDFSEIFAYLAKFGFHVVSFYSGGVDDLGWVWGDVLFCNVLNSRSGRVACTPNSRRSAAPPTRFLRLI